jgi:hypothetical protein
MMAKSIILHADEIRPLLAGQPVTVRREVKPQPYATISGVRESDTKTIEALSVMLEAVFKQEAPKGADYQPGDVLRVRETWRTEELEDGLDGVRYKDDAFQPIEDTVSAADAWIEANFSGMGRWRSAATMPAWASRLTVRVRAVTVEQVGGKWMWCYEMEREG